MPVIDLHLDGDKCWPDLEGKLDGPDVIIATKPIGFAGLGGGMASGLASVTIRVDLPDGKVVLVETSLRLLKAAVRALSARYPDPETDFPGL